MSQKLIPLLLLLFICNAISAQNSKDSIYLYKGLFKYRAYQNGVLLKPNEVSSLLKYDKMAHDNVVRARDNAYLSVLAGLFGGVMLGYQLGRASGGDNFQPVVLLVGGGLTVSSFILSGRAKRQYIAGIHRHNQQVGKHQSSSLHVQFSINSCRLTWKGF